MRSARSSSRRRAWARAPFHSRPKSLAGSPIGAGQIGHRPYDRCVQRELLGELVEALAEALGAPSQRPPPELAALRDRRWRHVHAQPGIALERQRVAARNDGRAQELVDEGGDAGIVLLGPVALHQQYAGRQGHLSVAQPRQRQPLASRVRDVGAGDTKQPLPAHRTERPGYGALGLRPGSADLQHRPAGVAAAPGGRELRP